MNARCARSQLYPLLACALLLLGLSPAKAKEKPEPAPQWVVDAAKTTTPASAKDSSAVILFDEYLITVDGQNHAVERERSAILTQQPTGIIAS